VLIMDGTTSVGVAIADASGNFVAAVTLAVGAHSLTAMGETSGMTSAAVTITIAPPPPPLEITSPVSGFSSSNPVVSVSGTGAAPHETVKILDGSTSVGTATADASGNFVATVTLSVGAHSLTVVGQTSGLTSAAVTVTITFTAPPPPVNIIISESIAVTDTPVVSDISDSEAITVTDTPLVVAMPATLPIAAPVAYFSAGSLGFGGIAAGQRATLPLTVSNIGQANLSLAVTSPGLPFSISQVACSNGASSLPTTLPSMGACVLSITYLAPSGTPPNGTITFTDNSPLSNVISTSLSGLNYTQSIPLQGAGSSTSPLGPPSLTVTIPTINETITVTDTPGIQTSQTYTVGGTLSGLTAGNSVTLADNGTDSLFLSANGAFTFAKALPGGAAYNVTVSTQTAGEVCAVTGGAGVVAAANVTSVAVSCKAPTLQIVPAASNPVNIAPATNGSGDYVVSFTVTNQGNVTASLVAVSSAKLGAAAALAAPAVNSLTNLAPGASGTFRITFPASAGSAGAKVTFSVSGTYSGSTLSGAWSFNTRTTFALP
jgi:hypothetical protein